MVKEIRSKIQSLKIRINQYLKISKSNIIITEKIISPPQKEKKDKIQALQRADIPVNKCRNKKTSRPWRRKRTPLHQPQKEEQNSLTYKQQQQQPREGTCTKKRGEGILGWMYTPNKNNNSNHSNRVKVSSICTLRRSGVWVLANVSDLLPCASLAGVRWLPSAPAPFIRGPHQALRQVGPGWTRLAQWRHRSNYHTAKTPVICLFLWVTISGHSSAPVFSSI